MSHPFFSGHVPSSGDGGKVNWLVSTQPARTAVGAGCVKTQNRASAAEYFSNVASDSGDCVRTDPGRGIFVADFCA